MRLQQQQFDEDHVTTVNDDINRLDVIPTIRFPFTKLPFLAFNTTAQFRNTFWSDSMDPNALGDHARGRQSRGGFSR